MIVQQNYFQSLVVDFARRHKGWVSANICLMTLHFPIELVLLSYLSGKIFMLMSNMKKNYNDVVKLILYFFLAYFVIEVCLVLRDTYDSFVIPELEREIRNYIIKMILDKNTVRFDQLEMGEVVARFLRTPAYSFYSYAILTKFVIPFVFGVLFIGFYVSYLNTRLGMLYFMIYAMYLSIFVVLCKYMIWQTQKKMAAEMVMFNGIEDTLSNIQTILTSNTKDDEQVYMDECQSQFIRVHREEMHTNTKIKVVMSLLSLTTIMGMFFFSIQLYKSSRMTKETFVSVITLLLFMCRFLGYTARRIIEGMMTVGSMLESNQFMASLIRDTSSDGDMDGFITDGTIQFNNVSFRYAKHYPFVLKNFSVKIQSKSRVVLIGDSGSGKTTFLRLILGFFDLEEGQITIDGTDIQKSKRSYLRQKVSYINQTTRLFDRTLIENITYGCGSHITKDHVLDFVQTNRLTNVFNKLGDNWLDKKVGKGGENLSGGMRQIVLLMRCYFRDSPIVIIDESTSSIDKVNRQYAITIMKQMFLHKTVICVSHDHDIINLFDRKLYFSTDQVPVLSSS